MEPPVVNQLVRFSSGGPPVDAIVVDVPSAHKAVVALVDAQRGPVLRTVNTTTLSEREEEGPQDGALHALIRRMPAAARGGRNGGGGVTQGRRGHGRSTMHRTTGK
jgi:hypothetical protein